MIVFDKSLQDMEDRLQVGRLADYYQVCVWEWDGKKCGSACSLPSLIKRRQLHSGTRQTTFGLYCSCTYGTVLMVHEGKRPIKRVKLR